MNQNDMVTRQRKKFHDIFSRFDTYNTYNAIQSDVLGPTAITVLTHSVAR